MEDTPLINKDGDVVCSFNALRCSSNRFCIYFSANWCLPCKRFTTVLRDAVNNIRTERDATFNVVFCTLDPSEPEMLRYFNECHGEWLAIPFDQVELRDKLVELLTVQTIPKLVVFDNDHNIVTLDGKHDIETLGWERGFDKWAAINPEHTRIV